MDIFFDTEFTNFSTPNNTTFVRLISIGCTTINGEEFYRELSDTYTTWMCSQFVVETVLPLLNGGTVQMPEAQVAAEMKAWIEAFDEEVIFRSDAPSYDWPFVEELFGRHEWPNNLNKTVQMAGSFKSDDQRRLYLRGLKQYWRQPENAPKLHNALVDARSLVYAQQIAMGRIKLNKGN